MRTRRIDSNNDWTFGAGRQNYYSGSEAVAQKVLTRLQSFKGNCFFNLDAGIDWITEMEQRNQQRLLEANVKTTILNTRGVMSLNTFSSSWEARNRKLTITASYTDIYGVTNEVTV
ncbi:hypothetical protein MUU49_17445 [Scandinavium goeteborgense]|uniref:hypothetical protein n=1 Tax=Scandinavium goeteborgense TaxID=1851514 RepID=UPI0021659CA5|nr:hypothetical protein [Scandinavium goeteborgense]MCS2154343.1 hypothetical protein [Scandinavium goeteborgense]